MARAPSTLPPMSPMSGAMVLHRPRAQSATPSLARKRSLGMLREMSPAVSSPFQNRLTRFSSPRIDSLPLLLPFKEPDFLPPRDIDFRQKLPPSNDREELPRHDRSPISPLLTPTLARGLVERRLPIMIDVDETFDRGNLVRVQPVPRRLHHPFPPSHLSSWSPPQPLTMSSEHFMFRISTLKRGRAIKIKKSSSKRP
jgi:hypothetical protein